MWKLHRYFLKEILLGSVLVFSILFGIVLISTVPRGLQRAVGFGLVDALEVTFLWTVDAIPHLLPLAPLFAVVLTYARASQEREITAIRAAGISPRVAMVPAVVVGLFFSLLTSFTVHYLVPWAHFEKNRVIPQSVVTALIQTSLLHDKLEFSGLMMTWERVDQAARSWRGVEMVLDSPDPRSPMPMVEGIVTAEEAWVEYVPERRELFLVLRDATGWSGENAGFLGDTRIRVDLEAISRGWIRDEGDDDLATDQLLAEVYRDVHPDPLNARYLAHRRSCFATLPSLFAPIGFVIGVLSRGRGRMTALLFSLVPVLLAYASDLLSEDLMRTTGVAWIAWLPAVLLIGLGAPFSRRFWRF